MSFPPIAIVGRACVLPGALSPAALWERVRDGEDLVSPAPRGRWRLSRERIVGGNAPGTDRAWTDRAWTDRGGYVEGFDALFDPRGFELPAEQVQPLDRVVRWLLHVSREALREAGVEGSPRVAAVFGNLSFPTVAFSRFAEGVWLGPALANAAGVGSVDARNRFMSGLPAHLVARALGLGAAFALDAACASSLYAIKLACDLLHDRRADVALAGAVNAADDLFIHVGFTALQALSRSGRSRPFHREADGLLPAEGAGAVALKRLEDAEAAGDRVFGVIRGVGLANDGRGRGLLAPAEEGQERAMRAAYAVAGLDASTVSLLECHATGTAVGDAAEVRSTARVFAGAVDLPVGSIKSNFGHAVTAAGIAGLLKVLGALAAGVRPPTLHVEDPLPLFDGTPLRPLRESEPWESTGPRRAAVSAFGFGGANAHLVVEEYGSPGRQRAARGAAAPASRTDDGASSEEERAVAVVGIGAAVGAGRTAHEFAATLFAPGIMDDAVAKSPYTPGSVLQQRNIILQEQIVTNSKNTDVAAGTTSCEVVMDGHQATSIALPVAGTRFPPRDLSAALPQQLWTLLAAGEALTGVAVPSRERVGVLIGMGCEPGVARYGARWRIPDYAAAWGVTDEAWTRAAADEQMPALEGAGVLGTMPNLPASRLNVQFDLAGPGFTVAAEELSGVRALQLGLRALIAGEQDLVLAGAADFSCEPVHEAAARELGLPGPPGDGAVVLALKRLADARRDGDRVLALVESRLGAEALDENESGAVAPDGFGDQAVATRFGRAHAAFGLVRVLAAVASCASGRLPGGASWPGRRQVALDIDALGGQRARVIVRAAQDQEVALGDPPAPSGAVIEYRAHQPAPVLPPLPFDLVAMPPAPRLHPAGAGGAPAVAPFSGRFADAAVSGNGSGAGAPMPPAPPRASLHSAVREPAAVVSRAAAPAGMHARDALAQIAAQVALATRAHRSFLADQAAAHQAFLLLRERAASALLAASVGASSVSAAAGPPAPAVDSAGDHPAEGAGETSVSVSAGILFDRTALETHASGRISAVFGPQFAAQDGLIRRVRMPEPPLLLADRVVRIDARALSQTTGTVWTETDIRDGAWYLHEGHMPAGIMVEAGQADLLLVSWLGADAINLGERVYRLLGCELTYHGGLPAAGDRLRYEIGIDGHAQQGDVRIFFFHSTCTIDGVPRLTVRGGQAGFFTDAELAASAGVLWDPAQVEPRQGCRLDSPPAALVPDRLTREALEALAAGAADRCFGPGFEVAATHTRTPGLPGGRMLLLEEVQEIAVGGGPWKRGYLRAVDRIDPGDWFFEGHFTNDPCMPGTLMFEGGLQAMAVYLGALGFTLERDGWRFEPVPGETYRMRCRGQVTPASRELVYEVFVEELSGGPEPTLYADILCTVDGLKAFHCRRMGLRLVPGWPLDTMRELLDGIVESGPVAEGDGVRFDGRSLLACAWGRPTQAFGPAFRAFDGTRRLARLPGPPYQFMSRVSRVEGERGGMREGCAVEVEYDIPGDAWYFSANGARTMPFAVLLEAALQPCGWLATWAGSPLSTERDLSFRNLDGDGSLHAEVFPGSGKLRTRAVLTRIAQSAGMLIESFDVICSSEGRAVYGLKTVFGYFPAEALARQVGLPPPAGEREWLETASPESVDLRARPARWCAAGARIALPPLLLLDRVSGIWPAGGAAGLGRFRGEIDVDPAAWFFKAHFFQDPVQPGSLGLEAMIQLLQFAMIRVGMADGVPASARFEPLALGAAHSWKYRGQVLPRNRRVTILLDLVSTGRDERGQLAVADASLWVDGTRIYEARGLAMRIVTDGASAGRALVAGAGAAAAAGIRDGAAAPGAGDEEVLDPAVDTWLLDHRPTWTVPALPLMSMVDRLARAAARAVPGGRVVAVEDARALRWVPFPGAAGASAPQRFKTQVVPAGEGVVDVTLLVWRDAAQPALPRFEPVATGRVRLAAAYPVADPPLAPPAGAVAAPDPYETGTLFHGPSFRLLRALALAPGASTALLDAAAGGAPRGLLHEALLDALAHGIPHDRLAAWSAGIPADAVAYPHRVAALRLYGPLPAAGEVRCETRFAGFDGSPRFPRFHIQAIVADRVVAFVDLVEVLFPKGPLGSAAPEDRRGFLRDSRYVPGLRLSRQEGASTVLAEAEVRASDWLPGTLARVYTAAGDLSGQIAAKEHVAALAAVHPSLVEVSADPPENPIVTARCAAEPLTVRQLAVERGAGAVRVRAAALPALDLTLVRNWWDARFQVGRWPVEDIYFGLAARFIRGVRLADPAGFAALRGRGVLYLANHQVGIESILFSLIASGLSGVLAVTLAKIEHRTTWLGNLIRHAFAWPGAHDPGVITYFDRSNREELPRVIGALAREIAVGGKSAMVHVEGTRALACRAPVERMSGAFLDMAIATGAPVVPVRFTGGLPVEPLAAKLEYPVGMGRQEILIGAAIQPSALAALPYKERKDLVIGAINGLGHSAATEQPSAPDPEFAAAAARWAERTGASAEHAVLFETMRMLETPGEEMALLLAGARAGRLELADDPRGAWLAELARRLFGPRGPAIVGGNAAPV